VVLKIHQEKLSNTVTKTIHTGAVKWPNIQFCTNLQITSVNTTCYLFAFRLSNQQTVSLVWP